MASAGRPCERCGALYVPYRSNSRFCGVPCRQSFHSARYRAEGRRSVRSIQCVQCGEQFLASRIDARFCNPACRSKFHDGKSSYLQAKELKENKAKRPACALCDRPIPLARNVNAVGCTRKCSQAINALKLNYGLSVADYRQMLRDQDNRCAICETMEWGHHGTPHVDHDHRTGIIRGLLCAYCNHGISKFSDSPKLLRRAAEYLER